MVSLKYMSREFSEDTEWQISVFDSPHAKPTVATVPPRADI